MRTVFRWLMVVGIVLHFSSLSAHAWWKDLVVDNEKSAAEYISELKAGAEPGSIERPPLRHINRFEAKQEKRRLIEAMNEAENLARTGKRDQIKELEVKSSSSSEEKGSYPRPTESNY